MEFNGEKVLIVQLNNHNKINLVVTSENTYDFKWSKRREHYLVEECEDEVLIDEKYFIPNKLSQNESEYVHNLLGKNQSKVELDEEAFAQIQEQLDIAFEDDILWCNACEDNVIENVHTFDSECGHLIWSDIFCDHIGIGAIDERGYNPDELKRQIFLLLNFLNHPKSKFREFLLKFSTGLKDPEKFDYAFVKYLDEFEFDDSQCGEEYALCWLRSLDQSTTKFNLEAAKIIDEWLSKFN